MNEEASSQRLEVQKKARLLKVNLLPARYRKKFNVLPYLGEFLPYIFILAIIVVSLNLLLGFFTANRLVYLKTSESVWGRRDPEFKAVTSLKGDVAKLMRDYDTLSRLGYSRAYFSQVMYLLYENLPTNIWFREVEYEGGILNIRGGALDYEKDASLSLREYLKSLRRTAIINRFPVIDIKSQEMRRIKDKSVLYFELELKGGEE
ncbi:hypothetical protein ACFL5X_03120 [Candidatus Omnitrophota bacterium]